jgi:hypothetical protein
MFRAYLIIIFEIVLFSKIWTLAILFTKSLTFKITETSTNLNILYNTLQYLEKYGIERPILKVHSLGLN